MCLISVNNHEGSSVTEGNEKEEGVLDAASQMSSQLIENSQGPLKNPTFYLKGNQQQI